MNATLDTALIEALPDYRGRDALYCLMAWIVEDIYQNSDSLTPMLDIRLNKGYTVRAYITAADCLFRKSLQVGLHRSFYGFILESKAPAGQYYTIIRGTNGTLEWIEDAEYIRIPHPRVGHVESGFWGIYETLRCIPVVEGVPAQSEFPIVPFIRNLLSTTQTREHCALPSMTTIGHSLGAALAAYLGLDIAEALKDKLIANTINVFASPHPGDHDFCEYLMKTCPTFRGWRYELDLVPRVPMFLGYEHPSGTFTISPFDANSRIRMSVPCHHHAISYVAMLDKSILSLPNILESAQEYLHCIVGEPLAKPNSPFDKIADGIEKSTIELHQSIAREKLRHLLAIERGPDIPKDSRFPLGLQSLLLRLRALADWLRTKLLRRDS